MEAKINSKKVLGERRTDFEIGANVKDDFTQSAMDESDIYAREDTGRMTREEVFGVIRGRENRDFVIYFYSNV